MNLILNVRILELFLKSNPESQKKNLEEPKQLSRAWCAKTSTYGAEINMPFFFFQQ